MAYRFYPAIIERGADGAFGVVFPDLPGCTSAGTSVQHAAEQAAEALALHVEGMLEDSEALPEPSAPDAPLPDWLAEAGSDEVARVLVPVVLPSKGVRVNITMDEGLLQRVDAAVAEHGDTRSGYIAEAVRQHLLPSVIGIHGPKGSYEIMRFREGMGWAVFPVTGKDGALRESVAMVDHRSEALDTARRLAGLVESSS
ncbi:Predicted nuclease of the RNAse H fold, HicB family [Roseomonas rosea]|uniref:Predicted nuclease of the RNAse H fold, HicB family n=1 Tax=Muricoccus roseus TaxID=198092 RepID=A0A1M6SY94_9PROT|nr:type II toxin-antitoxin system HicB family antitoxin [Roseomonas rosea]SHK49712.1 Predicted nuclease of the RNAse H fold, HicB family [Roseomonas rosea]